MDGGTGGIHGHSGQCDDTGAAVTGAGDCKARIHEPGGGLCGDEFQYFASGGAGCWRGCDCDMGHGCGLYDQCAQLPSNDLCDFGGDDPYGPRARCQKSAYLGIACRWSALCHSPSDDPVCTGVVMLCVAGGNRHGRTDAGLCRGGL